MRRRFMMLVVMAAVALAGGAAWGAEVRARLFEDVPNLSNYDEFVADESEYRTKVVFSTDRTVRNFKFLAIAMEDWDEENSRLIFAVKELYSQPKLTPERPLVVTLSFPGDTPNNGISFVDETGKTRRFAVWDDMSGEPDAEPVSMSEF